MPNHIYKETFRIKHKRISLEINFKNYLESIDELKSEIKHDKTYTGIRGNKQRSLKYYNFLLDEDTNKCCEEACEKITKIIKNATKHQISLINPVLCIYITILNFNNSTIGELEDKKSNQWNCFIKIGGRNFIMGKVDKYYKGNIPEEIKKINDFGIKNAISETLEHEFVHFIDIKHLKRTRKISKKIADKSNQGCQSLFVNFSLMKSEGLADLYGYRHRNSLPYSKTDIEELKKNITVMGSGKAIYYLGILMFYFIGLSLIYQKNVNQFNDKKANINGNIVNFSTGLNNVLNTTNNKIELENLPSYIIKYLVRKAVHWSHIKFLKEYESACKKLDIKENNIIFTLNDYKHLKKEQYNKWKKYIEKENFEAA